MLSTCRCRRVRSYNTSVIVTAEKEELKQNGNFGIKKRTLKALKLELDAISEKSIDKD